jgi:WD domain, G-beta repeat
MQYCIQADACAPAAPCLALDCPARARPDSRHRVAMAPAGGPHYCRNNAFSTVMSREAGPPASQRETELRLTGPSSGLVMKTQLQRTLESHRGCVNTVAFTTDGARLLSGSDDTRVIIWDWQRGARLVTIQACACVPGRPCLRQACRVHDAIRLG